jgi:ATP-binding cassette subfamily B protein
MQFDWVVKRLNAKIPTLSILHYLISLWPYLKPYKLPLILYIFLLMIQVAFLISLPLCYQYIFDVIVRDKNMSKLIFIIIILFFGFIIRFIADYFGTKIISYLSARVTENIRMQLFMHLQAASSNFFNRVSHAEINSTVSNGLSLIKNSLINSQMLIASILSGLLSTLILIFQSWLIGLLMIGMVILIFSLPKKLSTKRDLFIESYHQEENKLLNSLDEFIMNNIIIKLYNLNKIWAQTLTEKIKNIFGLENKANFYILLTTRATFIGILLMNMTVIFITAIAVIYNDLSIGAIFSILTLITYIIYSAEVIGQYLPFLALAAPGLQQIENIMALTKKQTIYSKKAPIALPALTKNIIFEHVYFNHPEKEILSDINMRINIGQSVALVGQSGSGKSTILNLLIAIYKPNKGKIIFDDIYSLKDITEESLHKQVCIVLQNTSLFNASIKDNIALGLVDVSMNDIIAAAKFANLHDDIVNLPQGYETMVTNLGNNLSMGQKQRIAIARAIIRKPRLLLLDEITSSLDAITEANINENIIMCSTLCTIVIATHRLNIAANLDYVYVIDQGKIIEQGKHQDLLNGNGLYAKLWAKQHSIVLTSEKTVAYINVDYLKSIPILNHCNKEFLEKLARQFTVVTYNPGHVLFEEGSPGAEFYLIARGEVGIYKKDKDTRSQQLITTLEDGDYFGEVALLRGEPRNATVKIHKSSTLLILYKQQFDKLLAEFPILKTEIEAAAAERK